MTTSPPQTDPWSVWLLRRLRATALYPGLVTLSGSRVIVSGASMYPLLHPGDRLLFDRLAYRVDEPSRGDVVLVRSPRPPAERLVKLIAGLPGEIVAVERDRLWIDGRPLAFRQPIVGSSPGRWQLGPADYFLLSYSVAVGTDSRHFGPVPRAALLGRAWSIYWPPERRCRRVHGDLGVGAEPPT